MEQKKSITHNYIMNVIVQGSAYILPFVVNPYVSGILGPEGMGKISFVTAVLSYFIMLAVLGVPTYGVREVSKVKDDKKQLSKTVYEILGINFIMGILTYIVFGLYIMVSPQTAYRMLFIVMCPAIVLNVIGIDWMYKGLEEFSVIAIRNILVKVIVIVLIFVCVHDADDIYRYGVLTICAAYGVNVWNFLGRKKYIEKQRISGIDMKKHLLPILIFFSMTIATTIYTNLDMVMLGIMKSDYDAGIYDSAAKLKVILVSAVSSLGTVLLPRVTELVNQKKMSEFIRISEHALNLIVIFAVSLIIYVEVNADALIILFSGQAFYESVPVLRVLVLTIILIGMTNIMGIQMMIPLGKEKMVLVSEIVGAVIDLIINMMLIPQYGALGAAIGTLIAEVAVLIVQVYACRDYAKNILCRVQYYKIFFSGFIAGISIFAINKFISSAIWKLCLSGILFYLLFGVLLLVIREKECYWLIGKLEYKRRKR